MSRFWIVVSLRDSGIEMSGFSLMFGWEHFRSTTERTSKARLSP
jgi:hypothetical protein